MKPIIRSCKQLFTKEPSSPRKRGSISHTFNISYGEKRHVMDPRFRGDDGGFDDDNALAIPPTNSKIKILFITSNPIGDAVLSSGVLARLVDDYPDAAFTVACGTLPADLFRALPRLEKLILIRKRRYSLHWWQVWRSCIGTHWDIVVDMRNSIVSRLLWSRRYARAPARSTGRHKVIDNASALGLAANPPSPRIWLDASAHAGAATIIGEGRGDAPLIAVAPAANWTSKQWPATRFAELLRRITASDGLLPNARVLVVAAPHERETIAPVLSLPNTIPVIGDDLAVAAACLTRCQLFIGNDSGLMHLSAALRVPTLGLFGPSDEHIYGPWGDKTLALRTPESNAALRLCLNGDEDPDPCLMEGISVSDAVAAVYGLWQRISDRHCEPSLGGIAP